MSSRAFTDGPLRAGQPRGALRRAPRPLRLCLLAAAIASLVPASAFQPGPQEDVAAFVAGLQGRYAAVNTVTAQFQQTYRAPGVQQTESGSFWMKKPGLMRWEYRTPEEKLFVADGRETYLYTPADRQVMVRSYTSRELQSTPLQFLLGRGDIGRSFRAGWEPDLAPRVQGTRLVRLVPRAAEPDYSWVVVECDEKTFELRRLVIRERTGNTSEFLLTDVETNVRIDDKRFDFRIPRGVEVIRVEER